MNLEIKKLIKNTKKTAFMIEDKCAKRKYLNLHKL